MDDQVKQERLWGMLCHLLALSAIFAIPFAHIIGPLVIWLVKKNDYAYVDEQGKESLNFQISMTIYIAVAAMLSLVLIGIPILFALIIIDIVLVIIASIKANDGVPYRYPATIRFLK